MNNITHSDGFLNSVDMYDMNFVVVRLIRVFFISANEFLSLTD